VHRDELLFQVTHQVSELWLMLAGREAATAADQIEQGDLDTARDLLCRTSRLVELVTDGLDVLQFLTPHDFAVIRTALGRGSGAQSPGWRGLRSSGRRLALAFDSILLARGVNAYDVHPAATGQLCLLAAALVDLDDRVAKWRSRHYRLANDLLGTQAVGTHGMPVAALATLTNQRMFPNLRHRRSGLVTVSASTPAAGYA
jgi:tryptophan 2,3-dioxygenase